jgi:hypothetical protein
LFERETSHGQITGTAMILRTNYAICDVPLK